MKNTTPDGKTISHRMLAKGAKFRFDCHPGVACFTRCCCDADMYLYPYDVIRMKRRLGISSEQFLQIHTYSALRDNPHFPSLMLKMSDDDKRSCPFLSPEGCVIYEDRPFSCRAYPLERAVARGEGESKRTERYFIARHFYCLGHEEPREWTVDEWIEDQKIQTFNKMNDLWVDMDTLFRANPWGPGGIDGPAFKMAFMACFNIDKLKAFICESSFLSRFNLPKEAIAVIMESDEELMKFGFDWTTFFLTGTGPFSQLKKTAS